MMILMQTDRGTSEVGLLLRWRRWVACSHLSQRGGATGHLGSATMRCVSSLAFMGPFFHLLPVELCFLNGVRSLRRWRSEKSLVSLSKHLSNKALPQLVQRDSPDRSPAFCSRGDVELVPGIVEQALMERVMVRFVPSFPFTFKASSYCMVLSDSPFGWGRGVRRRGRVIRTSARRRRRHFQRRLTRMQRQITGWLLGTVRLHCNLSPC